MKNAGAWRALLETFAEGRMSAPDFEKAFLDRWRDDRDRRVSTPYAVDVLMGGVDAYCADPSLRGPNDIDEAGLLAETRQALADFDKPWPEVPGSREDKERLDAVRRAAEAIFGRPL